MILLVRPSFELGLGLGEEYCIWIAYFISQSNFRKATSSRLVKSYSHQKDTR